MKRTRRAPAGVRATVVVPVLNGASTILVPLASLDAQSLSPEEFEVVVVDDGSTDGTREIVRAFAAEARARIRLVERPHAGPAAARNAGIAAAQAPVVAFTDADVEVARDWLERALARLEAEPALAAVEGRTLPKGAVGTLDDAMRNETGGLYMTCNMIYRRAALDSVGGFDERFGTAFLEDSDLAFRVLEGGGEIAFAPDVLAHHLVLPQGRRKFWREARKRFYVPLVMRLHPRLYRSALRPVVPAYPSLYVEELLALAATAGAAATRAWAALVPSVLILVVTVRRVAHAWRARDPLSILQAAAMPFVQGFWVAAGWLRFAGVRTGSPPRRGDRAADGQRAPGRVEPSHEDGSA